LKPLLLSSVFLGPAPRRTIPLLISSVRVIANVPADSVTTFPSGQAVSAAWIAAVASCVPLPYAAASMVADAPPRGGIPPGIPGFQIVRLSAGMTYGLAVGDGTPTASEPVASRPQPSLSPQESAATKTAQIQPLRVCIATPHTPGGDAPAMRRRDQRHAAACERTIPDALAYGCIASKRTRAGSVATFTVPVGSTHGQGLVPKKAGLPLR